MKEEVYSELQYCLPYENLHPFFNAIHWQYPFKSNSKTEVGRFKLFSEQIESEQDTSLQN